jgi:uncharacterized protein (DUF433 family)
MHPATVRTWFKGGGSKNHPHPLFKSDYRPVENDYAISFYDLIDVRMAGYFRNQGVSMHEVRKAYDVLSKMLETRHAFCHSALYTDGRKIFIHAIKEIGTEILREVTTSQQFFTYIKDHLSRIEYSPETHLAKSWRIDDGVVVNPVISFGKPTIEGTGTSTYIIASQYHANDQNKQLVADLYDITEKDVMHAVDFEMSLCGTAA